MPARLSPALLLLALLAPSAYAETGLEVKWIGGELRPGPEAGARHVVITVELHNLDPAERPVKPFPVRLTVGGQRAPDAEIRIDRVMRVQPTAERPAGPFDMLLAPGERAVVALPTRPLPAGHPALSGAATAALDFASPRVPRLTVRGPLSVAPMAPGGAAPPQGAVEGGAGAPIPAPAPWPAAGFQRGVVYSSWDGTYPATARHAVDLDHFEALGVTWIQVLTFAEQPRVEGPEIRPMPAARWPRAFVAEARRRGFRVLVKPHVWSREFYDGSSRWRGSIAMPDAEAWAAWFEAYGAFIEREARLAGEAGAEMFSVGLEYVNATKGEHTAAWRAIIERVRRVYPGLLTYAADGNHEARHVGFWDALDVIGVDAYFDVGAPALPGGADLRLGWVPHVAWMKALSDRHGKPIVFTEAGYPSVVGATKQPWKWPSGDEPLAPGLQAQAYDALMRACTAGDWCRGVFWWKYYEKPERGTSHAHDYSPRGKPAEAVLRRWYTTPAP